MKNGLKIAFVYIGLMIGAGFASGKDIVRFFSRFGENSLDGVVVATLLFIFISYIIMKKSFENDIDTFHVYTGTVAGRLSFAFQFMITLFMFSGFCVMAATSGNMLHNYFGANYFVGVCLLVLLCFIVFIFDVKGVVAVSSFLTPLMIIGIAYVSVVSYFSSEQVFLGYFKEGLFKDGLTENFLFSALCYVSRNTVMAAAVLIPMRRYFTKNSMKIGAFLGGGVMGLLIMLVWLAIKVYYGRVYNSEMPMMELAVINGQAAKLIYGAVIFMAVFTSAVSHGFGILNQLNENVTLIQRTKWMKAGLLCLLALLVVNPEFASVSIKLYSFLGYMGILWICVIVYDFFSVRKIKVLK